MIEAPDDYITDVAYTPGYYSELSPSRAQLALLAAGFAVPQIKTACELGFGQGVSLAIHAATSSAHWYGTDLHPEHVASATALVRAAGVDAHLYQDGFAAFAARKDLPDFDYIALNGVWSWVSDETRAIIVDFVRRRLNKGGVLYLSYISSPGWAPYLPLRDLLARHAKVDRPEPAPLVERIDASLAFADRLRQADAAFFTDNPAVARHLVALGNRSRRYLAHDYFNGHYRPMDFPTAASLLAPAQLTYVGPADIGSLESVYLTRPQQELLATIDDVGFREFVHDLLVNRYARHEYWVREPGAPPTQDERAELLRNIRVIASTARPDLPVKLRAALALNGTGPAEGVYRPMLDMVSSPGPVSLATIEQALKSKGASLDRIFEAARLIAGQEQLEFMQDEKSIENATKHAAKLNGHLLERSRSGDGLGFLASPVTATGIKLGAFEQRCLLAARDGISAPEAWAKMIVDLPLEEAASETPVERAHRFAATEMPRLKALGIA